MVAASEFKRQVPPIAKLGPADGRRRLPLPAPPAGQRAVVTRRAAEPSGTARRGQGRRGSPARTPPAPTATSARLAPHGSSWWRRRSATSPTSRCGRSRSCGAVPLVAAEDTRLTRRLFARHGIATRLVSYHARNAATRGPELLDHLRGGADLALVTDAGTPARLRPGRRAGRGVGRRRRRRRPGSRAVGRARGPRRLGDRRAALGVRGVPAALRPGAPRPARPPGGGPADERPLRGAGPPGGDAGRPRRGLRAGPAGRRLPGAHEAPRGGPAGDAGRPSPRPRPTGRSWPAARSSSWSARRASGTGRPRRRTRRRTRMPSRPRGPRSSASSRAGSPAGRPLAASPQPPGSGAAASTAPTGNARIGASWIPLPPASRSSAPCRRSRASWCWRRSPSRSSRSSSPGSSAPIPRILFVVSAVAILGLAWLDRPLDRAPRSAHGPPGRRHPQRDVRQHRRADHRLLRPAGRSHRRREGLAHRLDHRQPAARPGRQRPLRRPPQRDPALRPPGRRLERGAPGRRRDRPLRPGGLRPQRGPGRARGPITEESVLVAILLIVGYVLSLVFQFTNPSRTLGGHEPAAEHGGPAWSRSVAIVVLLAAAGLLAVLSEILVELDRAVHRGLRAVPDLRRRDPDPDDRQPRRAPRRRPARLEEQDGVLDGRGLRVEPPGRPLRRPGPRADRRASSGSRWTSSSRRSRSWPSAPRSGISALIALDGESNWLEGALLILVYVILAVSFFELRLNP